MGGELMVGIRDREGKEWLSLRWTNSMHAILANPKFYLDQDYLQEILNMAQPGHTWPKAVPTLRVEPSEYGVILVDFLTKRILSRQDYCTFGKWYIFNSDQAKDVRAIHDAGWITGIFLWDGDGVALSGADLERFWSDISPYQDTTRYYLVTFCPAGWTLDGTIERALFVWDTVQRWLADNEWTSPSNLSPDELEKLEELAE